MAEYYPILKGEYLTFQKATKAFNDSTVTVAEIGQNSEIYVAKWNGISFDAPTRITNNAVLDTQPQLAINGDNACVVWTSNSDNNILGITGTNSIYKSIYSNGVWSLPILLQDNLNVITNLATTYKGNVLQIAYVPDDDHSLDTIDDRDIYLIDGDVQRIATDNDTIDSSPVFAKNGTMLFWYNDGNIRYNNAINETNTVFTEAKQGLNDTFKVAENTNGKMAVLWTKVLDCGAEIQGALFDGEAWSEDIKISDTGRIVKYPNGILDESGELFIAFNSTEKVAVDDYYEDGQADLCTINITPSYNLSINNAYLNEDDLRVNTQVPINIEISNNGELAIEGFGITVIIKMAH